MRTGGGGGGDTDTMDAQVGTCRLIPVGLESPLKGRTLRRATEQARVARAPLAKQEAVKIKGQSRRHGKKSLNPPPLSSAQNSSMRSRSRAQCRSRVIPRKARRTR
eukprot:5541591-Pyramimonas_sp.AAC.1